MIKKLFFRTWDSTAAVIAAVMAALWLKPTVIESITTELIAFFAIQSAIILPAMIFTAGLLRGDGLTAAEVNRLQNALRQQMYFWVTLLGLDVVAVITLIIGKAANWNWKVTVLHWSSDLGWVMLAIAVFTATLAILRMLPFVQGVISLLDLNGWLAIKTIEARDDEKERTDEQAPAPPFERPSGYGRILPQKRKH